MKREVRFLGVDDGPFRFGDARTRIVGVVTRGASYVEGVLSSWCEVDGLDATERIEEMVRGSRFHPTVRALLLNGSTMGGFNPVDLERLFRSTGIPVVSLVRSEPDRESSRAALKKHFPDWEERWRLLEAQRPRAVRVAGHEVWVAHRGLDDGDVSPLLEKATVRGAVPEPIRLAHLIASGVERGESRGPA